MTNHQRLATKEEVEAIIMADPNITKEQKEAMRHQLSYLRIHADDIRRLMQPLTPKL